MAVSVVEGTLEEADVRRTAGKNTIYRSLRFSQNDGSSKTVKGLVARSEVAQHLAPGARGRFYLFSGFDLKGVHAVRIDGGPEVQSFPATNRKIFLIVAIVNFLWILLRIFTEGDAPLLGVAMLTLGILGFILLGRTESEAKAQFASDAGTA